MISHGTLLRSATPLVLFIFTTLAACEKITPEPLSDAPNNTCPCDAYDSTDKQVHARCATDRCEFPGSPDFDFYATVSVPDTSFFAPGVTFVLKSQTDIAAPKTQDPTNRSGCFPPSCIRLPSVPNITSSYLVRQQVSQDLGYPLPDNTAIPIRATYQPIAPAVTCALAQTKPPTPGLTLCSTLAYPTLPIDKTFLSAQNYGPPVGVAAAGVLPPGRYARVFFPEPPFDEIFPPTFAGALDDTAAAAPAIGGDLTDSFTLGAFGDKTTPIDDPSKRTAHVERVEGLDGFRVWIADGDTRRRLSVIRTLSGAVADVRVDTTGEDIGNTVDAIAILAPPDSYTAVPTYVTPLPSGEGLRIKFPSLPPPATVTGVVAVPGPEGAPLLGYEAAITFESDVLSSLGDSGVITPTPQVLQYSTRVATDDRGRFATLLPPGDYNATIEPAEGTGFAKVRQLVTIKNGPTSLTLRPPPLTNVTGRVLLTDNRPLADAVVVAFANTSSTTSSSSTPVPRSSQTTTGLDGRFAMELDPGSYILTVMPKGDSGFPWVVTRTDVPSVTTDLPDVRVPPPTRLSFKLQDPGSTGNVIASAVVRIFAAPAGDPTANPLEIGMTMSTATGAVEILLAQQPR